MLEKPNDPDLTSSLADQENLKKARAETVIFIVDDEEIMRNLLADVLKDEGYIVYPLTDGDSALKKIAEIKVDIVMTDIRMKGINGLELLRKIKELNPDIDVIVMTGYTSIQTAVESIKLGAIDYLTKPLNIDQIKLIVEKSIEQRYLKKKANESLFYKKLAQMDGLTELFNHRFFQELTAIEIARAKRESWKISIAMLDIDDFKQYNDRNGHPMGDLALKKFAWLLKSNCRECDFVARYGGEEFAIILPNTDKVSAKILGDRLVKIMESSPFEKEYVLPRGKLTVSIGIASFPEDASNREDLIQKADQALYQAKRDGKSRACVYYPDSEKV